MDNNEVFINDSTEQHEPIIKRPALVRTAPPSRRNMMDGIRSITKIVRQREKGTWKPEYLECMGSYSPIEKSQTLY